MIGHVGNEQTRENEEQKEDQTLIENFRLNNSTTQLSHRSTEKTHLVDTRLTDSPHQFYLFRIDMKQNVQFALLKSPNTNKH